MFWTAPGYRTAEDLSKGERDRLCALLKSENKPHYIIQFSDGSHWSSEWQPGFFHGEHRWIIDRIAQRSGQAVKALQTYAKEDE